MFDFLYQLAEKLDYFYITLLMAVESSVIPFPSEVVVAPAGYMAAEGNLNILLVILFATIGSLIGAIANYVVSLYVGRPIIYKFADSRLGRLCLLNKDKIIHAEKYFDNHGVIATLIGRLIPGIRQLISIPAGLAKMNFFKFCLYTTIGAGLWNIVLALLGYYLHSIVDKDQLLTTVKQYEKPIIIFICLSVVIAIIVMYFKNRKKTAK